MDAREFIEQQRAIAQAEVAQEDLRERITVVDFKMVTFSLSGKDYGIDIMNVKEIAKAGRFTYVPNTLPFVLGVHNLRGDIIPVIDLRLFFNVSVPDETEKKLQSLLILTVEDQSFGVVVDKIDKVVGVQKSRIQPPHPLFGDINIKYISGVVEAENRLYVLLDIARIFNSHLAEEEQQKQSHASSAFGNQNQISSPQRQMSKKDSSSPTQKNTDNLPKNSVEQEIKFISESLKLYKKFNVTPLNEKWVLERFATWEKERGKGKTQLQNEAEAIEFLKPFWSPCSNTWWTQDYAEAIKKALPDNNAKQIFVWNPGCGNGAETYSLACVLKQKYPESKIRIYAQDIDLLSVSNAPMLLVPQSLTSSWFAPFLSKKADGSATFTQDIKDSIMFEYHDCLHTNALPAIDIIFARDVLSLLEWQGQEAVISDFDEKVKGNGLVFVGEHEILPVSSGFTEKTVGTLAVYTKK
ncbi:MAG: chemotaxis protein CheW [Treponema sp.]|nr:chemotaxis protein CheW [Treponema sp.]